MQTHRHQVQALSLYNLHTVTLPGGPFDSGASREPSAHVTRNHAMNPIEVGRDANAIVALFAEGGTYKGPDQIGVKISFNRSSTP